VSASYTPSTAAAFGFFNTAGYRGGGKKIPRGDRSEHRAGKKRGAARQMRNTARVLMVTPTL
jgi:hypothetical protein